MTNRNKALFDGLAGEIKGTEKISQAQVGIRNRGTTYLLERGNALGEITSGDTVEKTLKWIDPAKCRMWSLHNRRYELLNEERCRDLIEGFKAQGRQEFPAIVRPIEGDPKHEYEVICGARRHWTVTWLRENNYPQFKFLVEVRELTDEEAFRLSDVENREREDISDYERALDYKKALGLYYKTQKKMAERLQVSEGWLSKYLDLADMPEKIVAAYRDLTDIKVTHYVDVKSYLKKPEVRQQVMMKAEELSQRQAEAKAKGGKDIEGAEVIRLLIDAAQVFVKRPHVILAQYESPTSGKKMLTVTRQGKKGLLLRVIPASGATKPEIVEACTKAIKRHL